MMLPAPRQPVADPGLTRPDWTKAQPRDPARLWLDIDVLALAGLEQ
jgi:hypothetical protein